MKIFTFITVRVNSNRLARKALLPIRGKRVIEHVIERTKQIKEVDGVVVCTSDESEDDILEVIAKDQGVLCFRGNLLDKLARFQVAAEKFGADYVVLIDADDLFCDPAMNDLAIRQIKIEPCDMLKSPDGLVPGAFDFCISASALQQVCDIKDTTDTEMYESYFLDTGRFRVCNLKVDDPVLFNDRVRLTLDYQEDYDFFCRVFDELKIDHNTIPLREIMKLIEQKPEIAAINMFRHKDYLAKRDEMRLNTKIKS